MQPDRNTPKRQRVSRNDAFTPGPLLTSAVDYGSVIRRYRLRAGVSQTELSRLLGLSASAVSNWENNISRPDLDSLRSLCSYLRMPVQRLLDIPAPAALTPEEREIVANYRGLSAQGKQLAAALLRTQLDHERTAAKESPAGPVRLSDYVCTTLMDLGAAAGAGVPLEGEVTGTACYLKQSPTALRTDLVIRVVGDSMEPRFHDGDLLMVQRCSELRDGEVGVFVAGGEGLVKQYAPDGLHSFNPAYATRRFQDDDHVRLVGRVLGTVAPEDIADKNQAALLSESGLER